MIQLPTNSVKLCPVIELANNILGCQKDILLKIKSFKNRTKLTCTNCIKYGSCEQLNFINQQIDIAIQEVTIEWGI